MNHHPLAADFGMYYNGTYIFRQGKKGYEAMMVEGTVAIGDDTKLSGFTLNGRTFDNNRETGHDAWRADTIMDFRPVSGYYDFEGKGQRSSFVTFSVNNRTQRKGIDPRNMLVNGGPVGFSGVHMVLMFEQSLGLDSRPGQRDIYISPKGVVHWKGAKVGTTDKDGKITMLDQFKQYEEMVCRLLQSI